MILTFIQSLTLSLFPMFEIFCLHSIFILELLIEILPFLWPLTFVWTVLNSTCYIHCISFRALLCLCQIFNFRCLWIFSTWYVFLYRACLWWSCPSSQPLTCSSPSGLWWLRGSCTPLAWASPCWWPWDSRSYWTTSSKCTVLSGIIRLH